MDQTQAQKFNEEDTAIYQEQMAALKFQGREKGGTRHNMNKSAAGVHDHIVAHSSLYPFYVLYFSKYTTLIHSTCPSIVIVYRYLSQIMKLNLPVVCACAMQACSLFSPGKYNGMYWI